MSKRKKRKTAVIKREIPQGGSGLRTLAATTEALYNVAQQVGRNDSDGIKRADVDVTNNVITVSTPEDYDSDSDAAALYGMDLTSVADTTEPFALVASHNGPPIFDMRDKETRSMVRQVLRRIVDEV